MSVEITDSEPKQVAIVFGVPYENVTPRAVQNKLDEFGGKPALQKRSQKKGGAIILIRHVMAGTLLAPERGNKRGVL